MGKWTKYKKRFCSRWEEDEELKGWIQRVPNDDTKALCKFCKVKIRAHRYGLMVHVNTEKHRRNEAEAFFSDTGNLFKNETKRTSKDSVDISDATLKAAKDLIPIIKSSRRSHIKQDKQNALIWPRVVLFGDSLTQYSFSEGGWGAMLADNLQRKCDVVNRGFSGYNSRWNTIILPRLFPDANSAEGIVAFVIFLGANDSNLQNLNPHQHVPAVEYGENLQAMALYLQSIGIEKKSVIIVGPPACDTLTWESSCQDRGVPMAKDNDVIHEYNEEATKAAKACGAQYVDLYGSMMELSNWPSFLSDGLHLSKEGSRFVYDQLMPCINVFTDSLPRQLPDWHSVNNENPATTLMD